jgi:uracil-DNA glycosylase family 4
VTKQKQAECDGKCCRCPTLNKWTKSNNIQGIGSKHPDIVVVGEYPDESEDASGNAFTGRWGQFFIRNIMRPLQINMNETYLTYAVKCWSSKKLSKNSVKRINATPNRMSILKCRGYLEAELKALKPRVIIALGNVGICSLFYLDKVQGISKWRGKAVWSREFDAYIVPIYSPSALMYDREIGINWRFDQTLKDVQLALECAVKPKVTTKTPKYYYLTDETKIIQYLKLALTTDMVALDSETDLMDPRNDILGITISYNIDREYNAYIPYRFFENPVIAVLYRKLCLTKKIIKILHNIDYDRKFFHYHGFDMDGPMYDTMAMSHLIDENFSVGLKERTWLDLDFVGYEIPLEKYKFEHKFTKNTSYKEIPDDIMAPYAALDGAATLRLYHKLKVKLAKEKLDPLFYKISAPTRTLLTDMSITGMCVDMKLAEKIDKRITKALKILEIQIYKIAGMTFNFTSTQQLSNMLFNRMKAPRQGLTKGNSIKCDKNVLKKLSLREGHKYAELAKKVMTHKLLVKAQSTYITQLRDYVWDDGRVHSSYLQIGAATGRVSSVRPAVLNIPKDKLIRMLYRASPGNKLIEIDVKSAEMRVIAILSNDQVLIDIIKSGKDIHKLTACEIFGISEDEVTDAQRSIAKCVASGSYIWTDNGLQMIDDVIPKIEGFHKCKTKILSDIGLLSSKKSYYSKNRKVVDVTTKYGYEISPIVTDKLRVFENNEYIWKDVKDLCVGDYVTLKVGAKVFGNNISIPNFDVIKNTNYIKLELPSVLTIDWAKFLGWYVSEGGMSSGKSGDINSGTVYISQSNENDFANKDIYSMLTNLFGDRIRVNKTESDTIFSISSVDLNIHLHSVCGNGSINKMIPKYILTSSKEFQIAFLQTLFEGDGTCVSKGTGAKISLTSKSKILIRQVQLLLLNFGIITIMSSEYRKGYGKFWTVTIKNKIYGDIFRQEVGFPDYSVKNNKVSEWLDSPRNHMRGMTYIPITKKLANELNSVKYSDTLYNVSVGNCVLTEHKAKSLLSEGVDLGEGAKYLINNNIVCVPILNISKPRISDVYDFFEPTNKTLVVNGINCFDTINFGIIYGLSPFGLAVRLGIDEDQAEKYIEMYFAKFVGVKKWLKDTVKFARANGYVISPFMRKRRLGDIKSDNQKEMKRAARQAMNGPVQGASADYVYTCLLRIDKQLKKHHLKSKLVNSVYDCAIIDCPSDEVDLVQKIALWAFRYGIKCMPIPFDADIEVSDAWGQNKKESALENILKSLNC